MISKLTIILEETRGENKERLYQFIIPMGAPLAEVEEMALLMVEGAKEVCQKSKEQNEALAAKAAAEAAPAVPVDAEVVDASVPVSETAAS